jgi:hypothetical protein
MWIQHDINYVYSLKLNRISHYVPSTSNRIGLDLARAVLLYLYNLQNQLVKIYAFVSM